MSDLPRVILDTMIVAEAAVNPRGPSGSLLRAADRGVFQTITSWHQLLEIGRTLSKRWAMQRGLTEDDASAFVDAYAAISRVAQDRSSDWPLTADPGDNFIIALAQNTHALIVTRDGGLLKHHPEPVTVIKPGTFVRNMRVWERSGGALTLDDDASAARLVMGL